MNRKRIYIVLSVVLILGILWLLWGNLTVGLTKLTITEETLPMAFHGLKIAHVSDLHNSHLWKQTIKQLQKAQPDIICITGDMVDCSHTNVQVALDFAEEAMKIAPCYYITGNHELNLAKTDYETLIAGLKHAGVHVLEDEAELEPIVKAADKLSAHIKCLEEQKAGNTEFDSAAEQTWNAMKAMDRPELNWFLDFCLGAFKLNLDQL